MDDELEALPSYPYSWSQDHELTIDVFLSKYKPSMVQNDGTKPWIWVKGKTFSEKDEDLKVRSGKAIQEAKECLDDATKRVTDIQNDGKIPKRSNKKAGAKSKKELREEVQTEATAKLKKISQENNYVIGKWLFFASSESIDSIWTKIASSLVTGPLAATPAFLAKVATFQPDQPQHLICLYLPNLYDKEAVTEVLRILVRNHGLTPSSAKTDLYTHINLDSKHASGIRSTIWQTKELLPEDELKKLKEEYNAAHEAAKPKIKAAPAKDRDDPFASEDEGDDKPEPKTGEVKPVPTERESKAKAKPASKRKTVLDDDADDDDVPEKPAAKKAKTAAPAKPESKLKRKAREKKYDANGETETESEEDEEEAMPPPKPKATKPPSKSKPPSKGRGTKAKPAKYDEDEEMDGEGEADDPVPEPKKVAAPAGRLGKLKAAKSKYD